MKMPFILGAWALLAATSAIAALVYDNNVGSTFVAAGTSDANRPFFQADEFRLAQAASVTSITWRGIYALSGTAPESTPANRGRLEPTGPIVHPAASTWSDP